MAYPDWVKPAVFANISEVVMQQIDDLPGWLKSLAPGTLVSFGAAKGGADYHSASSESTLEPCLGAWFWARHLAKRLKLDLKFGIGARMDVYEPSPFQTMILPASPSFVGQVPNADYTRRENLFLKAGYSISVDDRLPKDFVAAVNERPQSSPAWYCKTKPDTRDVIFYAWVLDWRIPGCIEWTRAWIQDLRRQFRPDFIGLAAKTGWHMHSSPRLSVPWDGAEPQTSLHRAGGDFAPSFYAEGEYEELLRDQIHWCLDNGIALTIQDRPSSDGTSDACGDWADERIREEVVGWA